MDDVHQRRSARELFKHIQLGIDHPLLRHQPMDMDGLETKELYEVNSRGLEIFTKSWLVATQKLSSQGCNILHSWFTETPELSSVKVVEHGHVKVLDWPEKLAVLVSFAKTMQFLHTRVIPDFFNNRLSDYYMPVYYLAENLNKEANGEGPKSW
ncbi:hypothetical protein ACFE04_031301 [Oxalis oulophora]